MKSKASPDGHLADCLQRLGAKRVEAKLLSCLLTESPLPTKDVVRRTELRQPEVSVGMRELRQRGWVSSEPIPREGKGRPMHRYRLDVSAEAVYAHFSQQAQEEMAAIRASLGELAQRLPAGTKLADPVAAGDEGSVAHA